MDDGQLSEFAPGAPKKSHSLNTREAEVAPPTPRPKEGSPYQTEHTYEQWGLFGDTYVAITKSVKKLPPGCYKLDVNSRGDFLFNPIDIKIDQFIRVPESLADQILTEIEHFWKLEKKFKEYGFLHRRGYLFYGPAGGGKSVIVSQIMDGLIHQDGIVLYIPSVSWISNVIRILRQIEPNRQISVILEDIDAIIENQGESEVLAYLDGEGQADQVLNIATTNYPERLDRRIVARPRRFDRVIKITTPDEQVRTEYFRSKANLTEEELQHWVDATEGFTFAALADLVISVKCFEHPFEDALSNLRKLLKAKPSSSEFELTEIGFGRGDGNSK